jgi:hypothetical protein
MWRAVIRFVALFVFTTVFVEANAFAQLTKLNAGYVGVTSDNAAAFNGGRRRYACAIKFAPI